MRSRAIKHGQRFAVFIFAALFIFFACQEGDEGLKKSTDIETEQVIEVETDESAGIVIEKSEATGKSHAGEYTNLAKVTVRIFRQGSAPEGTVYLRLVLDGEKLVQCKPIDVSQMTTSNRGVRLVWTLPDGGYRLYSENKYRIELIPSYSALMDQAPGENQINWLIASNNPYAEFTTQRVRNNTTVTLGRTYDFYLMTENYDENGNIYIDQETGVGISRPESLTVNYTDVNAPDGWIYGQEFTPLKKARVTSDTTTIQYYMNIDFETGMSCNSQTVLFDCLHTNDFDMHFLNGSRGARAYMWLFAKEALVLDRSFEELSLADVSNYYFCEHLNDPHASCDAPTNPADYISICKTYEGNYYAVEYLSENPIDYTVTFRYKLLQ